MKIKRFNLNNGSMASKCIDISINNFKDLIPNLKTNNFENDFLLSILSFNELNYVNPLYIFMTEKQFEILNKILIKNKL